MLSATAKRLALRTCRRHVAVGARNLTAAVTTRFSCGAWPPRGRSVAWLSTGSGGGDGGGGDDDNGDNNNDSDKQDDEKLDLESLIQDIDSHNDSQKDDDNNNDEKPDETSNLERLIQDIDSTNDNNIQEEEKEEQADDLMQDANELLQATRGRDRDSEEPTRRPTKKSPLFGRKERNDNDDDDDDPFTLFRGNKKKREPLFDSAAHNVGRNDPMLELLELQDDPDPSMMMMDNEQFTQELRATQEAAESQKRAEQKEEMDHKTGRGWTDPWEMEDVYASSDTYDDLPDWAPSFVSKMSQERVQILEQGIPSLEELAHQPLPPPPHPHPGHGHTKAYALHRSRWQAQYIFEKVQALAAPRIAAIQALPTWQDKQDAVDELFERIEFTLQEQELILGKHPKFGDWVEKALEKYLRSMKAVSAVEDDAQESDDTEPALPSPEQDQAALPIFMDCFVADVDSETENIPQILKPLAPLKRGANQGRMLEEWQLAAHKTTKRILLRQSTRIIAQFMESNEVARILVTGRQGTGKTAALLSIVAAARKSGHIVLFMPHVSMLAEFGYYIEPNEHRPGMYDLPVLSEKVCGELLDSHKDDLAAIPLDMSKLDVFFAPDQISKLPQEDSMSVADLLSLGTEKRSLAAMCYSAAIDTLMNQDIKPFVMVMDEFNTLFQDGKYFHMHYDESVRKAIPYNQINLFQPALDAMGLVASETALLPEPVLMKRGAVIAAMSGSKPVGDKINAGLETCAKELSDLAGSTFHLSQVPRLTNLEVEHVMANYETIGFGKLRMDQGETVANPQEVAYHRILSSNVPQELMNACVM